jgi:hypothetical protein
MHAEIEDADETAGKKLIQHKPAALPVSGRQFNAFPR